MPHPLLDINVDLIRILMLTEEPICQEHTSSVSGILIGTEGEVKLELEQGFNTATTYTVTSQSRYILVFDPHLKSISIRCIYYRRLVYP